MDLDLKNYNTDELLIILQIEKEKPTLDELQQALFKKIDNIKETNGELPDTKENIITFFTKAFFKIQNSYNLPNNTLGNEPSIGIQTQLQPEMQETHIVQQNNSMVSKHDDKTPISIWNTQYKAGTINPLQRTSMKKVLNVNTRFRQNYYDTNSADFMYMLPYTVKKVVSMKLKNTEFPKTVYTFSSKLGSNTFKINDVNNSTWHTITVPNGCYTPEDLVLNINASFTANNLALSLTYNDNTGKMTFTAQQGTPFNFDLNFNYNKDNKCPVNIPGVNEAQLTLGWMLGFRGTRLSQLNYSGKVFYTGEGIFDGHGSRYFLISVNDYQNNHNETFISTFNNNSLSDNNILAKISTECNKDSCCNHAERIYFGPVDLNKMHIKVMDEFGRTIDVNNADFSLTLELEVLYDL